MNAWGYSLHIDLYNCKNELITRRDTQKFIDMICKEIKMKKHGKLVWYRFGSKKTFGISFCQIIETSCITGHFYEKEKTLYLDIFSCKLFDKKKTITFCKNYFKPKKIRHKFIERK